MKALQFQGVTKKYEKRLILDAVSGSVSTGVTGILGPNGAGKTTLIRILAGLLPFDSGEFFLDTQKIQLQSHAWRQQIGYLPQSPGLYQRMTVREYLDYMLLLSGWKERVRREARIEEIITILNIDRRLHVPLGHLSGGTKQRVAIAQALVHDPGVVFLDEPTNNLDSEERQRFHEYLSDIGKVKIIFFIGHIINELASVCGKILILDGSKILFHDSPSTLISFTNQLVKQVTLSRVEYQRSMKTSLKPLSMIQGDNDLVIRYDSRYGDVAGSIHVAPTLEEAYKIILRS